MRRARLLRQRVPYAVVDFDAVRDVSTWHILATIAVQLTEHAALYRRITFPRLFLGLLAIENAGTTDAMLARERLARVVAGVGRPGGFLVVAGDDRQRGWDPALVPADLRLPSRMLRPRHTARAVRRAMAWYRDVG